MNILRLPPYADSFAEYEVPAQDTYSIYIRSHDRDELLASYTETVSYGEDTVTIPWVITELDEDDNEVVLVDFRKYDEYYYLEIQNSDDEIIVEDTLTVERPYVDPNSLVATGYTLAQATKDEMIARAIIDSATDGFYLKSSWMETIGEGTDYVPLWTKTYKILEAYENDELVYDSSLETPALGDWNYVITKDKSAITKSPVNYVGEYNRSESNPNPTFIGVSDSIGIFETDDSANTFTFRPGVSFPSRFDYRFLLEQGYKIVPSDIKEATLMLIDDLKCGKLDYYKRYITSYSTDQFRIQMDKSVIDGTGNILVDKILNKYVTNIKKMRML
jgi:hypothetical protein